MENGHGSDQAVIFGDPGKPGLYGILIRWHAGPIQPAAFPQHRPLCLCDVGHLVGEFERHLSTIGKTYPMPAGSVVTDLANTVHYDGAKDGEALLELVGMGPVTTTPAERNKHKGYSGA